MVSIQLPTNVDITQGPKTQYTGKMEIRCSSCKYLFDRLNIVVLPTLYTLHFSCLIISQIPPVIYITHSTEQ